jgi:DNA-binding NarL/FixJ family response regulator
MFLIEQSEGRVKGFEIGMGRVIRIGIVDDHPVFRLGLRRLFEQVEDLSVLWDIASELEVLPTLASKPVDVVLMDLNLGPGEDSLRATHSIVDSGGDVRVIVISSSLDLESVAAARDAGASGYLPKDLPMGDMVDAVRTLAAQGNGGSPFADFLSPRSRAHTGGETFMRGLTRREREVLAELRRGRTNREIAGRLGVSITTVNKHVQQVLKKLHAKSRAQAIANSQAAASGRAIGWDRNG